jgi:hypothetical protein
VKSWYWRDDNFRGLAELSALARTEPDVAGFADYLALRERGLRTRAFASLDAFLAGAATWPFDRRRRFVDWLLGVRHARPEVVDLLPVPLRVRPVRPTVDEWVGREPGDPAGRRWRGALDGGPGGLADLRAAVALDPAEQVARALLARRAARAVGFAVHELPVGYLGEPAEDLRLLDDASAAAAGLSDADERTGWAERLTDLRDLVAAVADHRAERRAGNFAAWAAERGRPYR